MKKLAYPVLIAFIVGGWFVFQGLSGNGKEKAVAVRRGNITAAVTATGKVEPVREAKLTFKSQGRLDTLAVSVGEVVQKGQLIASLDTTALELSLREAQATLDINKLKLDQARAGARSEEVSIAQANLSAAEARLEELKSKPTLEELRSAKAKMDKTVVVLGDAQAEYDKVSWSSSIESTLQARQLQLATLDYEAAKAEYEKIQKGPTEQEKKIAQSEVDSAKSQLAIKTTGASKEDASILEKQVELASIAVEQSRNRLEESRLTSPLTGTVLTLPVNVGELVGPQQVVVSIGDVSSQKVQANIDEVDVGKIAVGQEVNITFDAFPGKTASGSITKIAPGAIIQQGATVYQTTVEFSAGGLPIRAGMLANLTVSAQKRDNVLLVPNRALQSVGKKKTLDLTRDGNIAKREVETGLTNDTETEILSGVEEGELVVVR